jgi:hypothetical protein
MSADEIPEMTPELQAIHDRAIRQFDKIQSAVRDERLQCLEDRRFYSIAGAQWEGNLGAQFENKPKFEVNKVHLSVIRIINEYRNNRIDVDFVPRDGVNNDKLSDACDGLYRADEQDSSAEEAYDNAFEEAAGGGFGAWRLRSDYEDDEYDEDEDRYQRIRFEPIYDADTSVFFDLNAKKQDKSDAKRAFVLTALSEDAYEDEYEMDAASLSKLIDNVEFDWCGADVVYVAEYYEIEEVKQKIHVFEGLTGEKEEVEEEELEDRLEELLATGFKETKLKTRERKKIHKYIIDGARILEDCGYIAGRHIPIVPVYGKRWFVDNVERCMGHVRLSKDAQRLKNMQLSKLGELAALSSTEKPIFTEEQVLGKEEQWANDNIKDYAYLTINSITDPTTGQAIPSGPVGYTKPPTIPQALGALLQVTEQDIQDLLGNQQAGEQLQPNMSGKAVELIQNRLDMQAYIYMSNMAKAVKRCGEIWLGMAKDVYVEKGRSMKVISSGGDTGSVEIMKPIQEDGRMGYLNDLSQAKFDVAVDVGPSSDSKRSATVRALTGMMQITQDPETLQVLGSMAIMNMQGEGIGEVRDYFRKRLLRMGVVEPTDEEAQEMAEEQQNMPPDPNSEYLKAAAGAEDAKAAKARVDTIKGLSDTEKTRAETAEILSGIKRADLEAALKALDAINQNQPEQL